MRDGKLVTTVTAIFKTLIPQGNPEISMKKHCGIKV